VPEDASPIALFSNQVLFRGVDLLNLQEVSDFQTECLQMLGSMLHFPSIKEPFLQGNVADITS